MKLTAALTAVAVLAATGAAAQPGSDATPYAVHFRRGTDQVQFSGVMRQNRECCSYRFEARAGQVLQWRETGAVVRVVMAYPDGHSDGPGLPNSIALPQTGFYVFTISPNLMADGGFGRFSLRLRIPPLRPNYPGPHY